MTSTAHRDRSTVRRALAATALVTSTLSCTHTTSGRPTTPSRPAESSVSPTTSAPSSPAASTTSPTTTTPPALQRWYGREWDRLPTRRRIVALTFDAGGDAAGVPSILATLHQERVPATFFLTGNWTAHFPVQAKAIAAAARIGDHSQTHPHFTELSTTQIRSELRSSAQVIRRVCDVDPAPLFRFPYGDRDERTIDAVNGAGYLAIGWTVDTLGWQGSAAGITVTTIVARVLAAAQPGEIVLMHVGANPDDRSTLDAAALPSVIARLRARGYTFVTLDALLNMTP